MSEHTRTVLLLGAGASAASKYELPTMRGFFSADALTPDITRKGGEYHLLWKFLKDYYGITRRSKKKLKEVNLEEVLTHLHNVEHSSLPLDPHRRTHLVQVRPLLDNYVRKRLVHDPLEDHPPEDVGKDYDYSDSWNFYCEKHEKVFCKLDMEKDSILTINYDLIADGTLLGMKGNLHTQKTGNATAPFVERSMALIKPKSSSSWEIAGIGPSNDEMGKGYYMKLHGSLDYVYCPRADCPHHYCFFPNQQADTRHNVPESSVCKLCGSRLVLAIVPPAIGKGMDEFPKIKFLWSMAFNKLRDANRWIIWGVSLAESDHQLRLLLREAAQERRQRAGHALEVTVLNRDKDTEQAIRNVVQSKVSRFESAEEWLEAKE